VVLSTRSLVTLFVIRITMRLGSSLIVPVLPLFVQSLVPPTAHVASINGLISGVAAAVSAAAAVILGRASDRRGYRPVLLACAVGAAVLYVPQAFVSTAWQLLILQAAAGFVMGGVLASVNTSLANLAPEGRQGAVYGVDASAVSAAGALAPMIGAGVAAAVGLRIPFLLAAGTFALTVVMTWILVPKPEQQTSPAASD
jgi:DHA1 family multidrug resistance protein-like MFS transporter